MVDSKGSFISVIKNAIALTVAGLCLSFALPLYSAVSNNDLFIEKAYATTGWTQDGSYWYYYLSNGQPASGWQHIYHSNQWDYYYFESGRMKTGWFVWDGSWFYCADYHGQDVGFFDVDYGTCRMGWQEIYHSTGYWDWYYFRGAGSGRMETGWLQWGGYWYYLGNEAVGFSFSNPDYGIMLKDVYRIGAYYYVFKGDHGTVSFSGAWNYPVGAMLANVSYIELFNPYGSLIAIGWIDEYGHLYLYGANLASNLENNISDALEMQAFVENEIDVNDPALIKEETMLEVASVRGDAV